MYTLAEVAQHNKPNDCWMVVNGEVLDVTSFLDEFLFFLQHSNIILITPNRFAILLIVTPSENDINNCYHCVTFPRE